MRVLPPGVALVLWLAVTPRAFGQGLGLGCSGERPVVDGVTLAIATGGMLRPVHRSVAEWAVSPADAACHSPDLFVALHVGAPFPVGWPGHYVASAFLGADFSGVLNGDHLTSSLADFQEGAAGGGYVFQRIPDPHYAAGGAPGVMNFDFELEGHWVARCSVDLPSVEPSVPYVAAPSIQQLPGGVEILFNDGPGDAHPLYYQVLCADEQGQPLAGHGAAAFGEVIAGRHQLGYSLCRADRVIRRADMPTVGPIVPAPTSPTQPAVPPDSIDDGPPPFSGLDPRFVCTEPIWSNAYSARIEGLTPGRGHFFAVLAIDAWGRATVQRLLTAEPLPVEAAPGCGLSARHPGGSFGELLLLLGLVAVVRRHARGLLLAVLSLFGLPSTAAAQSAATCTGNNAPAFNFVVARQAAVESTDYLIIPRADTNLLGRAECECDSRDLFLRIQLTRPIVTVPEFHVMAGAACNLAVNQPLLCEDITDRSIDPSDFRLGAPSPAIQVIPVTALAAPLASTPSPGAHQCATFSATNALWFLFGPTENPDSCAVELDYDGTPPEAPVDVTADASDPNGAGVILSWSSPKRGTAYPAHHFQVLCADANGEPILGGGAAALGEDPHRSFHTLGYSTCVDPVSHAIQRRYQVTPGNPAINTDASPLGPDQPDHLEAPPPPLATEGDPGSGECPPLDPATTADALFHHLDKRFVCSDILDSTSTSARIGSLRAGQCYRMALLAIDSVGNATPSRVLSVTTALPPPPQPSAGSSGCSVRVVRPLGASSLLLLALLVAGVAASRRPGWMASRRSKTAGAADRVRE